MADQQFDEATSHAFGLASYHLQNALLTILMARGYLTMKEVALTFSGAIDALEKLRVEPEAEETVALAKLILQNSGKSWSIQARGN